MVKATMKVECDHEHIDDYEDSSGRYFSVCEDCWTTMREINASEFWRGVSIP